VTGRPGSDLLSHTLRCSTIGANGFHGRVRDGFGWFTVAITTRPSGHTKTRSEDIPFAHQRVIYNRFDTCLCIRPIKPIEQLVPVSFIHYCTSTSGLSTWWSSTVLMRILVSRGASRLDAFSGYPVRTWLPGGAAGATTGTLEVRPPRSSRTKGSSSQDSNTHGR
jgi:hypothetical protein